MRADTQRLVLDTVRHGQLTVIVEPSAHALAQAAVDSAWPLVQRTYGRAANTLSTRAVRFRFERTGEVFPNWSQSGRVAVVPADASVGIASSRLVSAVAVRMFEEIDSGVRDWAQEIFVPVSDTGAQDRMLYFELVNSQWHRVQDCHRGDIVACRLALGLDGRDDPLVRWYDGPERMLLVNSVPGDSGRARCRQGSDADCRIVLRQSRPGGLPPPFTTGARVSLLHLALHEGGADAYSRLVSSHQLPIDARLAAVAGMSTDSLVAAWRARVLAARPEPGAFSPRSAWTAVAWWVFLAAFALRSTRWR